MLSSLFFSLAFNKDAGKPKQPKVAVELLSPANATQLKAVFFSGEPWLVQCGTKADLAAAAATANSGGSLGAHEVLELALPKLSSVAGVRVGLLDCAKKLPSGKSTLDRFKLDAQVDPLLVLAANGEPPVQLMPSMLHKHGGLGSALFPSSRQQALGLVGFAKARAEKRAMALTKSEQLHARCLRRKYCVLVLFPREPSGEGARVLSGLMMDHRQVAFATLNAGRYELSLARHLPTPADPKQPQLIAFRSSEVAAAASAAEDEADKGGGKGGGKGGKGDGKRGGRAKRPAQKTLSIGAKAYRGGFSATEIGDFLGELTSDSLEMTNLKKPPSIRWKRQSKGEDVKTSAGGGRGGRTGKSGGGSGSGEAAKRRQAQQQERGRQARQTRQARGGGAKRSVGGAASKGGGGRGGGGGISDEDVERENAQRRRMAEEEEEYLRSMFGDADEEGGEEEGSEEEEVEEEAFDDDDDDDDDDATEPQQGEETDVEEEAEGGGGDDEKEEL